MTESENNFNYLVERIYNLLENRDNKKKTVQIPIPTMDRLGGKKIVITNSDQICSKINRSVDHLFKFLCVECATDGSINENKQIILRCKLKPSQMKTLISTYLKKYVMCSICESYDTVIERELATDYIACSTCKSRNHVK